jgi:hypothetical protein
MAKSRVASVTTAPINIDRCRPHTNMKRSWTILVLAALLGIAAPAEALAAASSYTSIAETHCRKFDRAMIDGYEFAATRVCEGRGGYKVFVREDDLREVLTVGKTLKLAGSEPAAADGYEAFNSYDDAVEWRSGADGKPYALIVGWSYADNENKDANGRPKSLQLLVVMRLPPGQVCKVAYIDRAANGNADELARKAADEVAPNFKCRTEKVQILGQRGRAIEAMSLSPEAKDDKKE